MINAKKELLMHVEDHEVEYVKIVYEKSHNDKILIEGTLGEIILDLDFLYDDGFGEQKLFGYIWYTDETWSDRRGYDGFEWWEYHERPHKDDPVELY